MSDSFCDPMTVAARPPAPRHPQAPLSVGFSRQEYWIGLVSSPGGLPRPGIEPASLALAGRFFTTEPLGEPL